jgi:hypothetical protein
MSEQATENMIEALLAKSRTGLMAAARRVSETIYDSQDERRDAMIDRVESYLFSDLDWEPIPATVISDVAHEIADAVINEG